MKKVSSLLYGSVAAVGIAAGILVYSVASAENLESNDLYPTNAAGQSYGSIADAPSAELEPDLIQAIGDNGEKGYLTKSDFYGDLPVTEDEVIAYMENVHLDRVLNLYDVDGKTVIGQYTIKGYTEVEMTPERYERIERLRQSIKNHQYDR